MNKYKAVVAGGLGVIGRNLVEGLEADDKWEVIGLSRRTPDDSKAEYRSVDLLDKDSIRKNLSDLEDVTHIFHAAYQEHEDPVDQVEYNLGMLKNLVEFIEGKSEPFRRVVLYEGAKYYGAHLGSFETPALENDPRHMPPNFYYNMEDWLKNKSSDKKWDSVVLRTDVVCGFAVGNPMNLAMVIAVYATICKELGLPLKFPGTETCYGKLAQVTDAEQLKDGSIWAALHGDSNEAYNLTNGDIFRWRRLWKSIADYFEIPVDYPQTISLTGMMADKKELWSEIQKRHGLQKIPYEDLAAWPFGDFILRCDWDVISDTTKIRQAGFNKTVHTPDMFNRLFDEFRDKKIIP